MAHPTRVSAAARELRTPKYRKARRRYIKIVKELSRLSHNGWAFAGPMDYEPLERELRKLARARR